MAVLPPAVSRVPRAYGTSIAPHSDQLPHRILIGGGHPIRRRADRSSENACITGAAISRPAWRQSSCCPSPQSDNPLRPCCRRARSSLAHIIRYQPPDAGAHPPAECQRQSADYLMVLDSAACSARHADHPPSAPIICMLSGISSTSPPGSGSMFSLARPSFWRHYAVRNQRAVCLLSGFDRIDLISMPID